MGIIKDTFYPQSYERTDMRKFYGDRETYMEHNKILMWSNKAIFNGKSYDDPIEAYAARELRMQEIFGDNPEE